MIEFQDMHAHWHRSVAFLGDSKWHATDHVDVGQHGALAKTCGMHSSQQHLLNAAAVSLLPVGVYTEVQAPVHIFQEHSPQSKPDLPRLALPVYVCR